MKNENMKHPVLVAIPQEWYEEWFDVAARYFTKKDIPTIVVTSKQKFLQLLDVQKLSAFVAISDWVVDDLESPSLIEQLKGQIPTVTIVTEASKKEYSYAILDKIYFFKLHQYCTVPFDIEELIVRLSQAIDAFND